MAVAGRVAIVPKGAYSETATYKKLDLVTYNEAAYIAKRESTGITPTDGDDWMLLVSTDLTEIRNEINDIVNGTTVVEKAANDSDGNKITETYIHQNKIANNVITTEEGFVADARTVCTLNKKIDSIKRNGYVSNAGESWTFEGVETGKLHTLYACFIPPGSTSISYAIYLVGFCTGRKVANKISGDMELTIDVSSGSTTTNITVTSTDGYVYYSLI